MKTKVIDLTIPDQIIEITEDTELLGLFIGRNDDLLSNKISVVHNSPNLQSLTRIKAVVYDKSRFDLEGLLIINKGAENTDAYLRIDVLIIGTKASARAIPSLEITEESVKGGHGATVGNIDEEHLYYLQSRGLSASMAEKMLVEGFIKDISDRISQNPSL